jgi:hypothetical protein
MSVDFEKRPPYGLRPGEAHPARKFARLRKEKDVLSKMRM